MRPARPPGVTRECSSPRRVMVNSLLTCAVGDWWLVSQAGEVIDLTSESPEAVARDAGDEEVVFVSARQPAKRRRLLPAVKTPGSKGGVVPQLPTPPPNHSYKCPVCLETCRSMTSTTCGCAWAPSLPTPPKCCTVL